MSPRANVAAVLLGAAMLAIVIIKGDEPPLDAQEKCDRPAMLAKEPDGGRTYTCDVIVDAGLDCSQVRPPEVCEPTFTYARRKLTQSTHVRARADDGSCLIREPNPGLDGTFKAPRFFGLGNRFPRAWAVGAGCEEVAGLVSDKADDSVDEAELIKRDAGEVTKEAEATK